MFTNKFNGHQGDVEFFSINKIEGNFKKVDKTFFAKSEKSGHVHAMCGDYDIYVDESIEDTFIVDVKDGGAVINHTIFNEIKNDYWGSVQVKPIADHHATALDKGIYKIGIQRRKKPFSKVWEKVID